MPSMSSYHHPHPGLDVHFLLGLYAFTILCGTKTIQIMSKQPSQGTRIHRLLEETHKVLDLLVQHSRMGQPYNFPQSVLSSEVAERLQPSSKCQQSLKRTWKAIEAYNCRSGCYFDPVHGANIRTKAEADAWDTFMASDTIDSREMAPFRNRGWSSYNKMAEPAIKVLVRLMVTLPISVAVPTASNLNLSHPTPIDDDIDYLLQLGHDIASPHPPTRLNAVNDALSMLSRVTPPSLDSHTVSSGSGDPMFSVASGDRPLAPSSPRQPTSLISSSKGKARAQTPTASEESKVMQARSSMADAAAMSGLIYAVNCAIDCTSFLPVVPLAQAADGGGHG
ncbi:hypothetical protein HD554DRAFT_2313506 [Boletus coccyginus]|nr:hypothetical protein HD554DRAFT_2313506 [Boletus coccyginus]